MNAGKSIQLLAWVLTVWFCGSAIAVPWQCGEPDSSSHEVWVHDPDKGLPGNPLVLKVIFVRFPDTPPGETTVPTSLHFSVVFRGGITCRLGSHVLAPAKADFHLQA
jgi:hypothetical protein